MVPTDFKMVVAGKRRAWRRSGSSFGVAIALALFVGVLSLALSDVAGSQTKAVKKSSVTNMTGYEMQLAAAINATRKQHGLRTLKLAPGLMRSAGKHSLQMACKGYFAHTSPNGVSFFARVKSYYGGGNLTAGENLLWARPRVKPRQVVKRWMASPGHRQVLLSRTWRVFGVGVVRSTRGAGIFRGRRVLLVTADFAAKN